MIRRILIEMEAEGSEALLPETGHAACGYE